MEISNKRKKIIFKMYLKILIFGVAFWLFYQNTVIAQQQKSIFIKGKVINGNFKKIYLDKYQKEPIVVDSSKITNGEFSINTRIFNTGFYSLRLDYDKTLLLILTPGDNIEITLDGRNIQSPVEIGGNSQSLQAFELSKRLSYYEMKQDSLNKVYEMFKYSDNKDSVIIVLRESYDMFAEYQSKMIKEFIINNLESLTGILFLGRLNINDNIELYTKYDSVLINIYPDNEIVKDFHSQVVKNLRLSLGKMAPDITEKDTSGNDVSLASLRGKVVLIDFWASWCGPCRRESPRMVKIYNQYRDKGFEIFGVSLDKDRNSWVKAIKNDKLYWTHVSDLGYWNAKPAKLYNVGSIPYTVLLDRNGKIIAKGLYGSEIEDKLKTVFNQ